jgi:HTH-type transcriptional regulator/antitoxin HigA
MATELLPVSDLAIPPGEYLAEVADELGLSQSDLAERMDRPPQAINEIFAGIKAITPETALQLERVTGVPAHIWTGLEAEFRLTLAKQNDERIIEEQTGLVQGFPYQVLAALGVVTPTRSASTRVRELCRFFGVASLRHISRVADYAPAFRAGKGDASANALAAWLRLVTLRAHEIDTAPFDRSRLLEAIPELRALTTKPPEKFVSRLGELLGECGVAFVLCPHFPKTYVHGSTFWLNPNKAVIATTIRGRWADVFWFSLFHEVGHLVLRHSKRETFLEDGRHVGNHADLENQADVYARDTLIPPKEFQNFIGRGSLAPDSVAAFARSIGIAPGIVVGRLQHDRLVGINHHRHRVRYQWVDNPVSRPD